MFITMHGSENVKFTTDITVCNLLVEQADLDSYLLLGT